MALRVCRGQNRCGETYSARSVLSDWQARHSYFFDLFPLFYIVCFTSFGVTKELFSSCPSCEQFCDFPRVIAAPASIFGSFPSVLFALFLVQLKCFEED